MQPLKMIFFKRIFVIKLTVNFSSKTTEARRQWVGWNIQNTERKKNLSNRNSTSSKTSLWKWRQIKTFSDIQRLNMLLANLPYKKFLMLKWKNSTSATVKLGRSQLGQGFDTLPSSLTNYLIPFPPKKKERNSNPHEGTLFFNSGKGNYIGKYKRWY